MPDGIPDHASAILSAGHLETSERGALGLRRAWRSAAFLTALADSSWKVAGRGRDGSPFFYQIWECWVLCDTSDGNRAFLSRSLCRSLMGRGFPNFRISEPDEPRAQNKYT